MKQSLYKENHAHTDDARNLGHEAVNNIKELVAEYIVKGYSPHEIEKVITDCLRLHISRTIIDIRMGKIDDLIKMAFQSKDIRNNY